MGLEIVVIGAFAVLTVGRIVWEKRSGRVESDRRSDAEAWNAIR